MESANLHHQHQLPDQLVGSSSLANPTYYGVGSNHAAWTPNVTLNNNFNSNFDGVFSNPRESKQDNDILAPCLNNSMVQDLGFYWLSNAGSSNSQSAHDLKVKEEHSESFRKYTELLHSSSEDYHFTPTSHIKNERNDLSEKLLLKTISTKGLYSNAQNCPSFGGVAMPSRGNFSQIYPSINISNLNQSPSSSEISSSLDMNLQALSLLTPERYSGSFSQPSHDSLGLFKASPSFGLDHMHMQQLTHRPSFSPNNISSPFTNRITEEKRPSSLMEAKTAQAASKKSRLEPRASCPPFKVRKEKLGDRIATLQQLVAPFGKTDTASVLMEAIGYIKFLHNQIETLSVPYMKSSRNKACRTMQAGSVDDGNEERKRDLRSRGLSLVPLSCMSYVTGDIGGGGIWPQPNYGGGGT
ncbi:transcription factor bHLH110 isoform X1 [Quercus robur]|uniref:transcription factor bHLH110 isoform X1 n=1 Tax=Quercus robur TaxID=38942 RepID=UPI00216155E7|nr:transcription factor bHLH110 isoform X1 [Quercus robur]